MKIATLFIFLFVSVMEMNAQGLPMPENIREAYAKHSRSVTGKPGPEYWQNSGRYNIEMFVFPPDRTIRGKETISYVNNSPDALRQIVMRLVMNIHWGEGLPIGSRDSHAGIIIDTFLINGQAANWSDTAATWKKVPLKNTLLPHDSIQLSISWHYSLSKQHSREGVIDSTSFYLAYFYPRVSVYDDYNGWDELDFNGQQEFYNDFNDYTLKITAPAKFNIWSTGELQNPEEVLSAVTKKRLDLSMKSDSTVHIATLDELKMAAASLKGNKTWEWKASHISDMAFGISDHFVWDAGSAMVDDNSGRRVSVQSAYNDTAADYRNAIRNGCFCLEWYSRNWPGVAYPYPKMSVFQGYADMEYPMMVNDASNADTVFSRLVEDHEIAHTYFPFYMGINESRYAFMDEGWATTLELLIGRVENGSEKAESFYKEFRVEGWIGEAAGSKSPPIVTPANQLKDASYGDNAYGKPSLGYLALIDMLGEPLFKKCLHQYMADWHGKHPIPWDFFYSFNKTSGTDLNWFWNNWFFSGYYIDLQLQKIVQSGKDTKLQIRNAGGFAIPFDVKLVFTDGSEIKKHFTPSVWKTNQKLAIIPIETKKKIKSAFVDGGIFMDATPSNNWFPAQ